MVILGEIRNNISASIFMFKDDNISRVNFAITKNVILLLRQNIYIQIYNLVFPSGGLDQYYLHQTMAWSGTEIVSFKFS